MVTSLFNLQPLSIGLTDVTPSIFFLHTNFTLSALQTPGLLNKFGPGTLIQTPANGDFILAKALNGSEYYTVSVATNGTITLVPAGGGEEGGFQYLHVQWVAQNGNNSNSGESIDAPKLDPQFALDTLGPLTGYKVLIIEDSAIYTDDISVNYPGVTVYAPNATLSGATLTMAANSGSTSSVYGNKVQFKNWNGVTYNDTSTNPTTANDQVTLIGDNVSNTSVFTIGARNTNLQFSSFDVSTCSISCSITTTALSFNVPQVLGTAVGANYNPLGVLDLASFANVSGVFGSVVLSCSPCAPALTLAQNVDIRWFGTTQRFTPGADINLTFAASVVALMPSGWWCRIQRKGGSGNVAFVGSGGTTILSQPANPETEGDGSVVFVQKTDTNEITVSGDVQNSAF